MEKNFRELLNIIRRLRAPDGCPWDRQQTLYSLRDQLIEETFEMVDAIDNKDTQNIKEELGDILLHVIMHSVIAEEENLFSLNDVMKIISEKLIHRHPHVFGNISKISVDEVLINWDEIKKGEKKERENHLDGIPKSLPAIQKAYKLQERAKKVGFDWESAERCMVKFDEEVAEFKDAIRNKNYEDIEEELGDVIFSIINLSRFLNVNSETALRKANEKFIKRFNFIEKKLKERWADLKSATLEEMEILWNIAKEEDTSNS